MPGRGDFPVSGRVHRERPWPLSRPIPFSARRRRDWPPVLDAGGGPTGRVARRKCAEIALDTDPAGPPEASNPAELSAPGACGMKRHERVAPMMGFEFREVGVRLRGLRRDLPPGMARIDYVIPADTGEMDHRPVLIREYVRKFRAVSGAIGGGSEDYAHIVAFRYAYNTPSATIMNR